MGLIWRYFSAVASRLIFVVHSIYSLRETLNRIYVGDAHKADNSSFWAFTILLGIITLEGAYTLIIRKGNEYKFFWPSGFIYVLIMIAITCILESFLMEEEIKCFQTSPINGTINVNLKKLCDLALSKQKDDQKLRAAVEIGMLGALVMGRWLLPRGELTRDQLSALLLNFISNGADGIEFLNTWNDFPVLRNRNVTNTVLVLYSFSMLQFAVVTTKTTDEYDEQENAPNAAKIEVDHNGNVETLKHPEIPIYLQKLMKNKNVKKKSSYSVVTSISLAYTADTLSVPDNNKSRQLSTDFYRQRSFTEESVFAHEITHSGKPKKLFSTTKSDNSVPPVARYLHSLASVGKWNEFSEALKQARNQGFSPTSRSSFPRNTESIELNEMLENKTSSLLDKLKCCQKFDQDIFQAVILMVSLEIPYLLARIVFAVMYNVSSTTMVFYTTKNIVMVVFLMYRLWVIYSGRGAEEEEEKGDINRDPINIK